MTEAADRRQHRSDHGAGEPPRAGGGEGAGDSSPTARSEAGGPSGPRRRRRAVGPPGARPAWAEPRSEPWPDGAGDHRDDRDERDDEARLRADVPPHHGPV